MSGEYVAHAVETSKQAYVSLEGDMQVSNRDRLSANNEHRDSVGERIDEKAR